MSHDFRQALRGRPATARDLPRAHAEVLGLIRTHELLASSRVTAPMPEFTLRECVLLFLPRRSSTPLELSRELGFNKSRNLSLVISELVAQHMLQLRTDGLLVDRAGFEAWNLLPVRLRDDIHHGATSLIAAHILGRRLPQALPIAV